MIHVGRDVNLCKNNKYSKKSKIERNRKIKIKKMKIQNSKGMKKTLKNPNIFCNDSGK